VQVSVPGAWQLGLEMLTECFCDSELIGLGFKFSKTFAFRNIFKFKLSV